MTLRPFLLCATAALLSRAPAGSAAAAAVRYQRRDTWQATMLACRAAMKQPPAPRGFKPYVSPVLRGGQPARRVSVNVRGARVLWLITTDAGDGIGWDHSAWGDPKLTAADGHAVFLSERKPLYAKVGWFRFGRGRDYRGRPIRIGKRTFRRGLFAHAPSLVGYELNGKFERFDAWVGVNASAEGRGSVRFEVRAALKPQQLAALIWKRIESDFPEEAAFMKRDLPRGRHLAWFAASNSPKLEREMLARVCKDLGAAGRPFAKEAAALQTAGARGDDPRWLALYLRAARERAAMEKTTDALKLAERTLEFVQRAAPRPKLAAELKRVAARIRAGRLKAGASWSELERDVRALRRRILFSHPLLAFDRLLIVKRPPPGFSHQCDQYLGRHSGEGPGLVVLDHWKTKPHATVLLKGKLPPGCVMHPDLSFDAKRVVFAFCDHTERVKRRRRFFLYEASLDGRWVRQLTGGPNDPLQGAGGRRTILIEDWDPCYLPDGGIAFVSTRSQNKGRCHGSRYVPSYLLYRMNADGSGIRPLSFGEANEWDPCVLHDGRLLYCRWDYINRHDTVYQGLWTTHPDGTGTAHFYGSYTRDPCLTSEAKAIPNSPKIVCTAAAHHSYTTGSIVVIDPRLGRDGRAPLKRITPEIPFPETEGWSKKGSFCTPYPLSEDLFLAAYTPEPLVHQGRVQSHNAFAIYLVDTLGGRELIYRDPDISCFSPIPIQPRPRPPALASARPAGPKVKAEGQCFVQNVYASTQPIPRRAARIRVNQILVQPATYAPQRGRAQNEVLKRVVGYAPLRPDGAAAFTAPAGEPLQLQLVDADGMAIMTMRSFIYLHPGETVSCIGCHEPRAAAPEQRPMPKGLTFPRLAPPPGPRYPGGFSFARRVQPVLDRYCIRCHGLEKNSGGVCLLGTLQRVRGDHAGEGSLLASVAFGSLVRRPGLVAVARRNHETPYSKPMDYFAHAGQLASMLRAGHKGRVKLDPDSFLRIVEWLDLNAQFLGSYSFNQLEWRRPSPAGERALRAYVRERFGPKLASQPFAALVNAAAPEESRILKAPLAVAAGGWGQIRKGGWTSTSDPSFQKMRKLVEASIQPLPYHDIAGTCGRKRCLCRSCWVRRAEADYQRRIKKRRR